MCGTNTSTGRRSLTETHHHYQWVEAECVVDDDAQAVAIDGGEVSQHMQLASALSSRVPVGLCLWTECTVYTNNTTSTGCINNNNTFDGIIIIRRLLLLVGKTWDAECIQWTCVDE